MFYIFVCNLYIDRQSSNDVTNLAPALEACQIAFESLNTSTAPFLCMPFISQEFVDTFMAMDIAASNDFADIYLAFMVDESDQNWNNYTYSVLGAFGMEINTVYIYIYYLLMEHVM